MSSSEQKWHEEKQERKAAPVLAVNKSIMETFARKDFKGSWQHLTIQKSMEEFMTEVGEFVGAVMSGNYEHALEEIGNVGMSGAIVCDLMDKGSE